MVQIVENWSVVQGRVVTIVPASLQGFTLVDVTIAAVQDVDGFPNLLAHEAGHQLGVHVPDAVALTFSPGAQVSLTVRRAGAHRVFAAPP